MKNSRRTFLKIAGMAALGWSVRPAGNLFASSAGGAHGSASGVHWGMVIDTHKLSDEIIEKCVDVCHTIHNVPTIDSKQEIKWVWKAPFHSLFPTQDHKFLKDLSHHETLSLCNHCENPPCVRVCPTKATFQREDGIVMMDFHRCIGCRYCMAACPYGSRSFNFHDPRKFLTETTPEFPTRTMGVVEKCEFCAERLAEGKLPACVEVSDGALVFGDLNDDHSEVRKLLGKRYSIRRNPGLGTEPSVYYLI